MKSSEQCGEEATMRSGGQLGQMESFDVTASDWTAYKERLTSFLIVNKVPDSDKVHAFLSIIGPRTYGLLKSLAAPDLPSGKSFEQLKSLLDAHLAPKPSIIGERAKFYRRAQHEGESLPEYVAELRKLSQSCQFGANLDEALRDRFVCGLLREDVQRVLFTEDDKLTFPKAVERALAMEAARKNVAETRVVESVATQLHKMEGECNYDPADLYEAQAISGKQRLACYRCGSPSHTHSVCPHVNNTCYKCGKKGHIQRACRSNGQYCGGYQQKRRVKTLKVVTQVPPIGVSEQVASGRTPIFVGLKIDGALVEMELDTGAAVSIMPYKQFKQQFPSARCGPTDIVLRTYTGALVQPCGVAVVKVQHGEQTAKLPLYLVDQAGPPLLGREWLRTVRLNWNQIWGLNHVSRSVFDLSSRTKERLESLLEKYKMLFKDELGAITDERAELFFKADHRPRFLKARNVPFALQSAVEAEIEKLVQLGILTPVNTSEYATPAVPVIKKDGSIRLCGDYKTTINPSLDITHYPLPKIDDLLAALAGGMHFSKIDLNRAYQQVLMSEESKKYLTLNTRKGLFAVNRLPFGIASAPGIFQKIMDTMLKGLNGVCCYLDDILVTGRNAEEHLVNLDALLKRLLERGVKIKKEKCAFFQNELCYLGHKITAAGISASPEKIEAVINAAAPTNKQQLQSFLGVVNYYGKFVPNLSTMAVPFYQLLRKDAPWCWDDCCRDAFNEVKRMLSSPQVLAHYDPDRPLKLACDASQYGVGAVLSHVFEDGKSRPVAFASRTLSEAEKKYSQLEKEALAIIFGIKKFHCYIYGRAFTLITDHKPLQQILGPTTGIPPIAAARLQRWAVTLSAYRYDLLFRKSADNAEADFCSRLPLPCVKDETQESEETFYSLRLASLPVSSKGIAHATEQDNDLAKVKECISTGWPIFVNDHRLKQYFARRNQLTLHGGCILLGTRVVIPAKLQRAVLAELHEGHPGIVRSKALARSYVWWPSIEGDLERMVQSCTDCQEQRSAPCKAPLHPWAWPSAPWQRIHIDFAGPFQQSMFLIVVDAHSKWPEVFMMRSTTADATIECLRDVFARFGFPETIVSDNGPQFTSEEFKQFVREMGCRHVQTAPYNPSTNGLAERFVQTLKNALKKDDVHQPMKVKLNKFLLAYRNTPHATTHEAPANLLLGRRLRTRLDVLKPAVGERVAYNQFRQTVNRQCRVRDVSVGDHVLARNYRGQPKWVPAVVMAQSGPVSFRVRASTSSGCFEWRRHKNQLLQGTAGLAEDVAQDDGFSVWPQSDTEPEPAPSLPAARVSPSPPTLLTDTSRGDLDRRYPLRNRRPPDWF